MIGISVPVPSVDDGAIVAALLIVWALRGRAATRVWAVCRILGFSPRSNVVLAGGSGMQRPSVQSQFQDLQLLVLSFVSRGGEIAIAISRPRLGT